MRDTYRMVWRWHFYAGLFVLPIVLILSVTGSIYVFKPQINRWEERSFRGLGAGGTVSPDRQLMAVLAANPSLRWTRYRLPEKPGDAAMIQMVDSVGRQREVYVSPQGRVLGSLDPEARIEAVVSRIHGSLLLGRWGDWIVELAASWTIVLILTGLYLWWPRPFRAAGTLWPRLSLRGRPLLKDIHRSTGFWIAGLVLVMLVSGLPWAGAWGTAFEWAREEAGLVKGPRDWKVGASVAHHHGMASTVATAAPMPLGLPLSAFVKKAEAEHMAFPAVVLPPHAPQLFGSATGAVWTVKAEPQNRPLARQVTYDAATGAETGRSGWADQHLVDRIVNTGVAWHEGQLFGWVNQLIALLTAIALVAISALGALMWVRRRPASTFGAPERASSPAPHAAIAAMVVLGVLLPLFGASLLAILLVDRLLLAANLNGSGRVTTERS